MRICITGPAQCGKTSLAWELAHDEPNPTVVCTDQFAGASWHDQAKQVVALFSLLPGPWIIEGVTVLWGLERWLEGWPGRPCDRVIWLSSPWIDHKDSQARAALTMESRWPKIKRQLRQFDIEVVEK